MVEDGGHRFMDSYSVKCELGWEVIEGDLIRICQSDGSWSGEDPVCQGKEGHEQ